MLGSIVSWRHRVKSACVASSVCLCVCVCVVVGVGVCVLLSLLSTAVLMVVRRVFDRLEAHMATQ